MAEARRRDYSRADKTGDESKQDAIMAQGHVAAIYGNGWEVGAVTDPKTGNPALGRKLAAFPMPGAHGRPVHRRRSSVAPTSR